LALRLQRFGARADPLSHRRYPSTGETIAEVPKGAQEDVDQAVRAARSAYTDWFETTPRERSEMLLKLADAILADADELANIESANVGKPRALFLSEELWVCADNLRYFAGAARILEGRASGEYMRGYTSMIRREPIGVVGSIAPWNYLLMMAIWKIGPALAAGNTVILKPTVVSGGSRIEGRGFFYRPSLIADVSQDSEIVRKEVFGPVVTVQRFKDDDQALAWANDVDYGLAASVWTRDISRALNASRRLQFGTVWINTHIPLVSEMPHGGYKQSGYGKDLSMYSLEEYTQIKHVMAAIG